MKNIKEYAEIIRKTWHNCPHNNYYCTNCQSCNMVALANYMLYNGMY